MRRGGKGIFITFHSLEKHTVTRGIVESFKETRRVGFKSGKISKKAKKPSRLELSENRASTSAEMVVVTLDDLITVGATKKNMDRISRHYEKLEGEGRNNI